MKTLLFFFFSLFLIIACQNGPKEEKAAKDAADSTFVDTFPKATAIFWVDKRNWVRAEGILPIATAKAKVVINEQGKVNLKSFIKRQDAKVQRYLRYHLEVFRVQKIMMDSGFVKPGEQYVQLRYMPEKAQKFK